jgi:hypothetical protein
MRPSCRNVKRQPGQQFEVKAGLAELDAVALDLSDPEAFSHELV